MILWVHESPYAGLHNACTLTLTCAYTALLEWDYPGDLPDELLIYKVKQPQRYIQL